MVESDDDQEFFQGKLEPISTPRIQILDGTSNYDLGAEIGIQLIIENINPYVSSGFLNMI